MTQATKPKRSSLTIIMGLLLVIVGVGGFLYSNQLLKKSLEKGDYRFISKLDNSTPMSESTTEPTFQAVELVPDLFPTMLNIFAYYVHSIDFPDLENPNLPDRIEIPNISLIAPVVIADFNFTKIEGETFGQWVPPSEFAAAWHPDSAPLGKKGNTVINGHHNEFGEVFGKLVELKEGDLVYVYSRGKRYTFIISNRMILPERFQDASVRLENAKWLGQTSDVRLTLVTCWPADSNTHRLILVARPFLSVIPFSTN